MIKSNIWGAETRINWSILVNTIAAEALAPYVKGWEMIEIENAKIFLIFSTINSSSWRGLGKFHKHKKVSFYEVLYDHSPWDEAFLLYTSQQPLDLDDIVDALVDEVPHLDSNLLCQHTQSLTTRVLDHTAPMFYNDLLQLSFGVRGRAVHHADLFASK